MTEAAAIFMHQTPGYWARKYCEKGWRVVPLHGLVGEPRDGACTCKKGKDCGRSAGKHPVYASWQTRASADFTAMEGEFADGRNIGLAMGAGLVAVDVDGDDGMRSFRKLYAEHPDWPNGPVQETGSGGLHFLFRTKESFKNSVKIVDGIDIRSDAGQIVAAPSQHRSGRRYRWMPIDPSAPDGPSSFDLEVPELPEWLASILRGSARLEFDIDGWLREQDPAIQGENGSSTLMRVTHKLVRAGMCRTFERFAQVVAPWNARCSPTWSDRELQHAFDNAFARFKTEATVELPVDKNGQVICTRVHLDAIVRRDPRYEGQFRFNARAMENEFRGRALTDQELTRIEVEICDRYRLRSVNAQWLRASMEATGDESSYDPVADYLRGLRWDGVPRIAQVPADYLKSKPSPLFASIFRRWMIGTARRALQPGCQMDNVLILHGPQGCRKSTFFRTMARGHHTDTKMDLANKDAYLTLHRAWILEWSELASIARLDNDSVKCFVTSLEDDFRPPYGRTNIRKRRAGVIVGSTNRKGILTDPTGARRYWIIPCEGLIDIDGVAAVVDQLWAEAVAVGAAEQHHLTNDEDAARIEMSKEFTTEDSIYHAAFDVLEY